MTHSSPFQARLALLALLAPISLSAQLPECQLCSPTERGTETVKPQTPLTVEIEGALDFSRVALSGTDGAIGVDARTGARLVSGGVIDLGGMGLRGAARVTGEPFAPVVISLPQRVTLRSTKGDTAEVIEISSDLPAQPMLDGQGTLRFSFGGRLLVKGAGSGAYRGSIPISANYP